MSHRQPEEIQKLIPLKSVKSMMRNKRCPKSAGNPESMTTLTESLKNNTELDKLCRGIVEIENSESAAIIFISNFMTKFLNDNPTLNARIEDFVSVRRLKIIIFKNIETLKSFVPFSKF